MICPECADDLEIYPQPDIHTHWCEQCGVGFILEEGRMVLWDFAKNKWISIEEAEVKK